MRDFSFVTHTFKEGDTYIAYVPALDLSSCGDTGERARHNIRDAVRGFLATSADMGTLDEILQEAGYEQEAGGWRAPEFVSVDQLTMTTIVSGVRVHFLISDPQGALPPTSRLEPSAVIGVTTPSHQFRSASVNSRVGNVIDVMITVPHNQPVTTWVHSNTLKFTDSTGAPPKSTAVSPAPGATDYNIPLSVSR